MNARTRLIGTVALGAALFVPVAQADRPDDAGGLLGPGAIASQQANQTSAMPDATSINRGANALSPDNSAEPRGPGAIDAVVIKQAPPSGFDFGDALIGMASGMGLALLITGGVILLSNGRSKTRLA
jgi:hypothetical protein